MKYIFSLILIFFNCSDWLLADSLTNNYLSQPIETLSIDESTWDKAIKDLDYSGDTKKSKVKEDYTPMDLSWAKGLFKILLIVSIVVLLLFLLRFLVGVQDIQHPSNRKFDPNKTIDVQVVADNIHDFDLENLLNQSIEKKDYATAIRLYYLLCIKSLSNNDLIQWKKNKTNRDYLNEITSPTLRRTFSSFTLLFERIWYGEMPVTESDFNQIQVPFRQFIDRVNKIHH